MSSSGKAGSGNWRRREIVLFLEDAGFSTVANLAERFNVSEMTIRRDLRRMLSENLVTVVHGGVLLPSDNDYGQRGVQSMDAKRHLAQAALQFVPEYGAVLLDAGTTVMELVRELPGHFKGSAISHSVPALVFLMDHPQIDVFALGGEVRSDTKSSVGPSTVDALSRVRADVGFLGAAGIGPSGLYVSKDIERTTKLAFMEACERTVLLVDHTKLSSVGRHHMCDLGAVDVILTDVTPEVKMLEACAEQNVELHVV